MGEDATLGPEDLRNADDTVVIMVACRLLFDGRVESLLGAGSVECCNAG